MFAKRIIPCLDIKDGRVVKGVNFLGLRDAGDPVETAAAYSASGADEVVFWISTPPMRGAERWRSWPVGWRSSCPSPLRWGAASVQWRIFIFYCVRERIRFPTNSAAIDRPDLYRRRQRFGSQCVVVAIDARRRPGRFRLGRVSTVDG